MAARCSQYSVLSCWCDRCTKPGRAGRCSLSLSPLCPFGWPCEPTQRPRSWCRGPCVILPKVAGGYGDSLGVGRPAFSPSGPCTCRSFALRIPSQFHPPSLPSVLSHQKHQTKPFCSSCMCPFSIPWHSDRLELLPCRTIPPLNIHTPSLSLCKSPTPPS